MTPTPPPSVAVVVADPSAFNRRFTRAAVERRYGGSATVSEAATIVELLECIARTHPAVIVVEPSIEEGSDIDLVAILLGSGATPVVFSANWRELAAARDRGFIAAARSGLLDSAALETAIDEAVARLAPSRSAPIAIETPAEPAAVADLEADDHPLLLPASDADADALLRSVLDEWSQPSPGTTIRSPWGR